MQRRDFIVGSGVAVISLSLPDVSSGKSARTCKQNLQVIHEAVGRYRKKFGSFPPTLSTLVYDGLLDRSLLICPVHRNRGTNSPSDDWLTGGLQSDPLTLYSWKYGDDEVGIRSRRQERMGVGGWTPMVQCSEHLDEGEVDGDSHLNLCLNGGIFHSSGSWEFKMRHIVPYPYLVAEALIEGKDERSLRERIPKRSPDATAAQIDLSDQFNGALDDPWPEGYPHEATPDLLAKGGENRLWRIGDVDFEIRGVVQIEGTTAATSHSQSFEPRFPFAMKPIERRFDAERLHLLCGVLGKIDKDDPVATILVTYEGGEQDLVLRYGQHVRHDWELDDDGSTAEVVWRKHRDPPAPPLPEKAADVGLRSVSLLTIPLGDSAKTVKKIEFVAADTACYPLLLAITAE